MDWFTGEELESFIGDCIAEDCDVFFAPPRSQEYGDRGFPSESKWKKSAKGAMSARGARNFTRFLKHEHQELYELIDHAYDQANISDSQ